MDLRLGLDGMSWLLTLLTLILGGFAVIVSWREIDEKTGFFHANLMFSLAGTIGVFIALDLFLFFYFWELMLVPMVFIIAIWGHENRRRAAIKFLLYTQGSGLLILIAILALAFHHQRQTGSLTFDYFALMQSPPGGRLGYADHARAVHRLRGQAGGLPGPCLAAGDPYRGADRRLRHSRQHPAENRRLRAAALRRAADPGCRPCHRAGRLMAGCRQHPLRRRARLRPVRS